MIIINATFISIAHYFNDIRSIKHTAITIGYIQVNMSAASWQLARIHARSTHCARDNIINSLRSALCEELIN